jgi:hypothetical protein
MLPSVRPCRPHTRLIPPWCRWVTPSSLGCEVGSPGVCADRIARPCRPWLRPGRLPRVLQIPPRGGHPTLFGYGPYPVGPAGLSPAREKHCRAHIPKPLRGQMDWTSFHLDETPVKGDKRHVASFHRARQSALERTAPRGSQAAVNMPTTTAAIQRRRARRRATHPRR